MKEKLWYKLDNAGKLYPSITRTRISTVFRLSATLYDRVDKGILMEAAKEVMKRFPYFNVNLKKGVFWYYFEEHHKSIKVEAETFYPCMFLDYKKSGTFPLRILYYKKRISVEFSHSITDGTGALVFLKALLETYMIKKGMEIESDILESPIREEEWEDSFNKYYEKRVPAVDPPKKAVHLPMKLIKKGEYYIINGTLKVEDLKELGKRYGCTITELLTALYFESIIDYIKSMPRRKRRRYEERIVLNVPINLRKLFPSVSMRNFFISLTPYIDMRLGDYTREELISYIRKYMSLYIDKKNILQYIKRNVANEHKLIVKIVPLFIKNIAIKLAYNYKLGESSYTSSISNMGLVKFKDSRIDEYIKSIHFYPPPSRDNKIKVGLISYKGKVQLTFGKLTEDTNLEKIFFRKIRKEGIRVKIETNMEEE